jgi:GTPase SAR1 family protein
MALVKTLKSLLMKMGLIRLKARVVVIGLENSGKTTVCRQIQRQDCDEAAPTMGYEINTFKLAGKKTGRVKVTSVDMSGQERFHSLWDGFLKEASVSHVIMCVSV